MNIPTCILIQGPLITFGQGPNINLKGFQSYDCIIENTTLILAKGIMPVLCLWATDKETEQYKALEIFYKENGLSILVIDIPDKNDPDHRYKHHFAINSGLEYCRENFNCNFFVKIRTDQHITESIIDELMQLTGSPKMLISELMPDNHFYIGDFIYAGSYETVKRYLLSQIAANQGEVKYSVIANDLGFNYYRSWKPISKWTLILIYLFTKKRSAKLWSDFVNAHLVTLSAENWITLRWRGKKMTDVVDPGNFLFVSGKTHLALVPGSGLPKHIYYVKGKYKRLAKKMAMRVIGR